MGTLRWKWDKMRSHIGLEIDQGEASWRRMQSAKRIQYTKNIINVRRGLERMNENGSGLTRQRARPEPIFMVYSL